MSAGLNAAVSSTPAEWQNLRLKDLCVGQPAYGTNIGADAYTDEGLRFIRTTDLDDRGVLNREGVYISPAAADEQLRDGDLLLSRSGTIGRSFLYSSEKHGPCSYAGYLVRFRFRDRSAARFAFWFTKSLGFFAQIEADAVESTIANFNGQRYAALRLLIPNDRAQCDTIADFLDRETAKIDALIAKQEELIERIEEKRKAFTTHAVTNGVGAASVLRESGVEWIGNIPTHWSVMRMKRVAKLESGHTPSKTVPEYWINCNVPWVSLNDTKQLSQVDYISDTAEKVSELGLANSSAHILPERAVVFTRDATVGLAAITTRPMAVSQHLIAWICKDDILPEYLLRVIYAMKDELDRLTAGATIKTIGMPLIGQLMTPLPPIAEQKSIVAAVELLSRESDAAIGTCEEILVRLRERRAALITAAVTGQIDVRAAPIKTASVASNDNQQTLRVVVGAEIVARHGAAKNFGRVKFQKLLYLAEVHTGISELGGNYLREAAGPLARDLLSATEHGMAAGGFYKAVAPVSENDGVAYERIGAVGAHRDQFTALLGERAAPLTKLIDLFKDYSTRDVEAITTLYAVWNDALLDGEDPDDTRIIRGFLDEWHPEKRVKFKEADLPVWLAWMRRNSVVPSGSGIRTYTDQLFV